MLRGEPGRAPSPGSARTLASPSEQPLSLAHGAASARDSRCTGPCGRAVPGARRQRGHSGSGVCRGPEEGAGRISCAAAHPAAALPLPQMPSFVLSPSQGRCTSASPPAREHGGAGPGLAGIPDSPRNTGAAPLPGCCGAAACDLGSITARPGWMDGRTALPRDVPEKCGRPAPELQAHSGGDTGRGMRSTAGARETRQQKQHPSIWPSLATTTAPGWEWRCRGRREAEPLL